MEYRGYQVLAEVEIHNFFSLNRDGAPEEYYEDGEGFDVTGYKITNVTNEIDVEFFSMGEADVTTLHALVDAHIAEREV